MTFAPKLMVAALGLAALSLQAPPARAAGPEIAVRLGLALPAGDLQSGTSLSTSVSNTIPMVLEAGYRVDPSIFLGARFQYAVVDVNTNVTACAGNASCGGSNVAVGVEGIYLFVPASAFAPWLGASVDYEWLNETASRPNMTDDATVKGWRGGVQFGGDVRLTPRLVVGPFIEAQFGRYETLSADVTIGKITTSSEEDLMNTTWHEWVLLGVRGAFGF